MKCFNFLRSCHLPEIFFIFFFLFALPINAAPYKVAYTAEYFPKNDTDLDVKLAISITNLRSDVYVREFSMTFPAHFSIDSPSSKLGELSIQTAIEKKKTGTTVTFALPENSTKGNQTDLHVTFTQKNGIKHIGSMWEILLPAIADKENATFTALLHVPKGVDRHVGISKPAPSQVNGDIIRWDNVDVKVIYITFGTSQRYQTNLTYTLKNPDFLSKKTTIALPPQTSLQKIYEGNINPRPSRTFLDTDGNYLAEFELKPKQELIVHYSGIVEVFARPQNEMNSYISKSFTEQKKYILDRKSYWNLESEIELPNESKGSGVFSIFNRVINHLSYDTSQISSNASRKGANLAIKYPDQAVCTEYTDLFIALARKAGIPAREIEGYAYSDDASLRPLSFSGDILHSWPEYFDESQQLWIPVDPTWADTSSIDYFNSFDLNHIVLAIHGKDPVYPLPAGMYKLRDGQDVSIKPVANIPKVYSQISASFEMHKNIDPNGQHEGIVIINNDSNVFLNDSQFTLQGTGIQFHTPILKVPLIAPHEKKLIPIKFSVSKKGIHDRKSTMHIQYNNKIIGSNTVKIRPSYELTINYILGIVLATIFLIGTFYVVKKSKKL